MYELLVSGGFDGMLLLCLIGGSSLIGLSAGGAPGVGSLAGPTIALGFTRFDKPQAVVTSLLILGQLKCLFPPQREHIDFRLAGLALIPATVGLVGGIWVWAWLISLEDSIAAQQIVKACCGLIVMTISADVLLARVLKWYQSPQLGLTLSITVAFLGGILSTVANVAGPLFTWYFQSKGLNKHELTATVAFFFFTLNIFKLPFYIWLGLFHDPAMFQSLADWLVFAALGSVTYFMWHVGAFWRKHASERMFSAPIAAAGLTVGSLIIWQSLLA